MEETETCSLEKTLFKTQFAHEDLTKKIQKQKTCWQVQKFQKKFQKSLNCSDCHKRLFKKIKIVKKLRLPSFLLRLLAFNNSDKIVNQWLCFYSLIFSIFSYFVRFHVFLLTIVGVFFNILPENVFCSLLVIVKAHLQFTAENPISVCTYDGQFPSLYLYDSC